MQSSVRKQVFVEYVVAHQVEGKPYLLDLITVGLALRGDLEYIIAGLDVCALFKLPLGAAPCGHEVEDIGPAPLHLGGEIAVGVVEGSRATDHFTGAEPTPIQAALQKKLKGVQHLLEPFVRKAQEQVGSGENFGISVEDLAAFFILFQGSIRFLHRFQHLRVTALKSETDADTAGVANQGHGFIIKGHGDETVAGRPGDGPPVLYYAAQYGLELLFEKQKIVVQPLKMANAALVDQKGHLLQHRLHPALTHPSAHEARHRTEGAAGAAAAMHLDGGKRRIIHSGHPAERVQGAVSEMLLHPHMAVAVDEVVIKLHRRCRSPAFDYRLVMVETDAWSGLRCIHAQEGLQQIGQAGLGLSLHHEMAEAAL